jgi:hypothetical protein
MPHPASIFTIHRYALTKLGRGIIHVLVSSTNAMLGITIFSYWSLELEFESTPLLSMYYTLHKSCSDFLSDQLQLIRFSDFSCPYRTQHITCHWDYIIGCCPQIIFYNLSLSLSLKLLSSLQSIKS